MKLLLLRLKWCLIMLIKVQLPVETFLKLPVSELDILCGQQFLYSFKNSPGAWYIMKIEIIENGLWIDAPTNARVSDNTSSGG